MSDSNASASASVSMPLATIAVVFLAVAKVQNIWGLGDLSWWWVFAPYWLGLLAFVAIILLVVVVAGVGFGIAVTSDALKRRKRVKANKARR